MENPKAGQPRSSRTYKSVESVNQSVHDDSNFSIRKRANALNVHRSSFHRNSHKNLKLHPYKIQLVQESKPLDSINKPHPYKIQLVQELKLLDSINRLQFVN